MEILNRCRAATLIVLLLSGMSAAQDLTPALAARFSEGVAALKDGDRDAAERAFRDVLRAGGNRAFVHHNLGIVLQQRGRHAEALAEFEAAQKLDASFGPARLLAGASLLALGRPRNAVSELEQAVRLMPEEATAHLQLGSAYERAGNSAGAVDQYRWLARRAPSDPDYAFRLGKAYLALAQWSFEHLKAIDPQSARLQQALGEQYLDQGRPDLALRAFQEATNRNPRLPEIHLALARIHFDAGRLDDAAREVARELAIAPESVKAHALKAALDAARKP
jgi:tetratricopeptide (TPR) repeat protein